MKAEGWELSTFTINGEELPPHIESYLRMRKPHTNDGNISNYVDIASINYAPTMRDGVAQQFMVKTNGWEIYDEPDGSNGGILRYNHAAVIPARFDLVIRELHDQIQNFEKKVLAYGWGIIK